jgi:hypothetical protein
VEAAGKADDNLVREKLHGAVLENGFLKAHDISRLAQRTAAAARVMHHWTVPPSLDSRSGGWPSRFALI